MQVDLNMKELPPFLSDEEHLAWLDTPDAVLAGALSPESLEVSHDGVLARYTNGFGNYVILFTPPNLENKVKHVKTV